MNCIDMSRGEKEAKERKQAHGGLKQESQVTPSFYDERKPLRANPELKEC